MLWFLEVQILMCGYESWSVGGIALQVKMQISQFDGFLGYS